MFVFSPLHAVSLLVIINRLPVLVYATRRTQFMRLWLTMNDGMSVMSFVATKHTHQLNPLVFGNMPHVGLIGPSLRSNYAPFLITNSTLYIK